METTIFISLKADVKTMLAQFSRFPVSIAPVHLQWMTAEVRVGIV